jgi:choline dehydrogenase-like flavoprotein
MPVPVVHFKDHANDVAMRNHAYKARTAVYQSLGATRAFELPPFPSTHNMGTCRQSEKAQDGVCKKYGQAHDVANLFISDGSQFTTGGAENPTLTIVALAIRQADYLADQFEQERDVGTRAAGPAHRGAVASVNDEQRRAPCLKVGLARDAARNATAKDVRHLSDALDANYKSAL